MAEVVVSVASKVSEYLVDPILKEVYYLFCVCKIIKDVENEKRKLSTTRCHVSERAKEAEMKRTERVEDVVQKWLQEVQSVLDEVENMEKEVNVKGCFRELCPTWKRYRLCKQLSKKMIVRMRELNSNSKFERFSSLASLPTIEYFSSGNFTFFESTKLAWNQLLEAMTDDNCYMICLYGMGGCGKTTLSKEVGKKAKELGLFENVVFVTVSQTPDVRRIQGEIADQLGLRLTEESETGRARRLSMRLQSGERILVILDDVWSKLNLEDAGIPVDHHNLKGCKVLFTTRLQHLYNLMDCQRNVPLSLLSEEEAWVLFQQKASITDKSSSISINTVAREVAMECKGLPIAIDALGTSLKGKSPDVWKAALDKLRHSKPIDVEEGVRDAFSCLQLSYDHLRSEEAKNLFLMCSLFPEDHNIFMEDLFRYGIGLGIFGEANSLDISRSQVNTALNHLLDYSLLMHSETGENHFKMHDMVGDFALWMSSKKDCTIMVDHAKGINSLAFDGAIKNSCLFSTWYEGGDQFPQQLDAPKLEILLLHSRGSFDLTHASFEGMEKLKVMAIMSPFFQSRNISLSQSIQSLTNLRTFRLVNYQLGDISPLTCLRSIEILDLSGSTFNVLPNGIGKLNKLKLLDLSNCKIIDCSNIDVIGQCSQLEEVYVYHGGATDGKTIIESHKCFMESISFMKLQRYRLQIGPIRGYIDSWDSSMTVLLLGALNISTLGAIVKYLLQRAEAVALDNLLGDCKNIFPEFVNVVGDMNQLTRICLRSCAEMESLINTTVFKADHRFPMLVELMLEDMDNLKQVCNGPPPLCIFQKLEEVYISHCHQLESIFPKEVNLSNLKHLKINNCPKLISLFPVSVAQTLQQLVHLEVEDCCEMKHIIKNEGQHNDNDTSEGTSLVSKSLDLMLPELKFLDIRKCDKLEYLHPLFSAEDTRLENVSELVFLNCLHMTVFPREWNLSNLKILTINHCHKHTSIFSISVVQTLMLLEEMHVEYCRELKCIIYDEVVGSDTSEQTFHVSEYSSLMFPKLRILSVGHCDKLEYIFPIYCAQGLVQLQWISISDACEMKYVFGKDAGEDLSTNQNQNQILFPQLKWFRLFRLPNLVKICSGDYYPNCPLLKELTCHSCPKLTVSHDIVNADLELTRWNSNTEVRIDGCQGSNHELAPLAAVSSAEIEEVELIGCGVENMFHLQGVVSKNDQQELIVFKLKELGLAYLPVLRFTWTDLNLNQVVSLAYLQSIYLNHCSKLKCVFPAVIHRSLPHLTRLLIYDCENLEEIFAENEEPQNLCTVHECFPRLEELRVKGCTKLKNLFSIRMATSFPSLRTLSISEMAQLEEVFGHTNNGDNFGNAKEIMLPNLTEIELENLPNLIDLCQGFSLLTEWVKSIQIHNCPKIAETSACYWRTKGVRVVVVNGSQSIECSILPLNDLYSEEVDDCGVIDIFQVDGSVSIEQELVMESSKVVRLGSENGLWRGPISSKMLNFKYLCHLRVRRCKKLKSLFSSVDVIHEGLPALVVLNISDCDELEEIIAQDNQDDDEEKHQNHQSQLSECFPKLRELVVERCNKLRRLFPVATTLPQLQVLCISEAALLQQVFDCEREDSINNNGDKISLMNLQLQNLPRLVDFTFSYESLRMQACEWSSQK